MSAPDLLIELFLKLSKPKFWQTLHDAQFDYEHFCKQAHYFHGPKRVDETPGLWRFRRSTHRYCKLPVVEAEKRAHEAERQAAQQKKRIDAMWSQYRSLDGQLRLRAPALMRKLPTWEKAAAADPDVAARKIDLLHCDFLARNEGKSRAHDKRKLYAIVDSRDPQVVYQNDPYQVSSDMAEFFDALIKADGAWVKMAEFNIRTRNISALPKSIRGLIERRAGKGSRISPEKLKPD